MALLNKQSKKTYQEKIQALELELSTLKNKVESASDTVNPALYELFEYLLQKEKSEAVYIENEKIKFIQKNPSKRILNTSVKTISDLNKLVHSDDLAKFSQFISSDETEKKLAFRINVSKTDGSKELRYLECSRIINSENKEILVFKNISKQVRKQRELNRNQDKAIEADKIRSILLANISHYIRTPLNSITGFAEILATSEPDSDTRKDYIEVIKRQSKRLTDLVDDITEISKFESGRINITKTRCNLNLILNEIYLGFNQQQTKQRKEQVSIHILNKDEEGIEVLTDSGRLQQVISNIVNFSLRHTEKGSVSVGYDIDAENGRILFKIQDTSPGLTKEEQKVLFNKFSVIDISENSKLDDPGLGLTISKAIIKALNGRISVSSELGKGTIFEFSIPYESVDVEDEEQHVHPDLDPALSYHWPNKVILIVEDEDVNAMFLDAVFHGSGLTTLYAKNGAQAVELCKKINQIDLILMDLKMPVMNGLHATLKIREFNKSIPIIAQTALSSEDDREQCFEVGCNDVISKPIEVEEMLKLVNGYLAD